MDNHEHMGEFIVRLVTSIALSALVCATALTAVSAPAAASVSEVPQDQTVSADPADITPHVLDGEIFAVAVVGSTVVLGGTFSQAKDAADGSPTVARSNLLSFDRMTGVIRTGFAPVLDGEVRTLAAAADGTSVYVGGKFNQVDGQPAAKLARLDVVTGAKVAGFAPGSIDGPVLDLELAGSRLFVGGNFSKVGSTPRKALAELDPATGAVRTGFSVPISGTAWGGYTGVAKIDTTPDGSRMVIVGNFRTVGGLERVQIAMLDIAGASASVVDWSTQGYAKECGKSVKLEFDLRDIDFSPDGSYFVTAATGGLAPKGSLCDAAARWETAQTGADQKPTWIARTGNDSVYSVGLTGSTVYVGGHFRWFNNPFGVDFEGPGAISRPGIAALDPVNGLPLTWNPGRDRGRAVWDLVTTEDALYAGNDTSTIGGEYHGRIAMFPLAGGAPVPQPTLPALDVDVRFLSPPSEPDELVRRPDFDGTTAGPAEDLPGSGWASTRAAFLADGRLYTATSAGTLVRYDASGDTFANPTVLDLHGLDDFADELATMTSMVLDRGRITYSLQGSKQLYRRAFTVQSGIVGAVRTSVPAKGLGVASARGAFLTTDGLFVANRKNGTLARVEWVDGSPVPGTRTVVSGPKLDGISWKAGALVASPAQ